MNEEEEAGANLEEVQIIDFSKAKKKKKKKTVKKTAGMLLTLLPSFPYS